MPVHTYTHTFICTHYERTSTVFLECGGYTINPLSRVIVGKVLPEHKICPTVEWWLFLKMSDVSYTKLYTIIKTVIAVMLPLRFPMYTLFKAADLR